MGGNSDNNRLTGLVIKYDRPGPRYTSYPTVPEWSDTYGAQDYAKAIRIASKKVSGPLSLYLHLPFCRKRCWFCGCNTNVTHSLNSIDEYLARVHKETDLIVDYLGKRRVVSQFHWGGGSPSILTDAQTERAFNIFRDHFEIQNKAEISIELDPRVTTSDRINVLKRLGFNRLSMGVQDFDPEVQKAIGRDQSEKQTVALYRFCRDRGFTGINFDLIYGLPGQTIAGFTDTIAGVIDLRPDRVAMYSFAFLPKLKAHQRRINPEILPDAEAKLMLFSRARRMFLENGYCQIGMDHFVLPDDELAVAMREGKLRRNFMGYTVNAAEDWLGVGMSSISYISGNFAQNASGIDSYNAAIDSGRLATFRGAILSADDLIRQRVITDLMCNFRVDITAINAAYTITFDDYFKSELVQVQPFIDDGLLTRDKRTLRVTEPGQLFVRNIAMIFDAYLAGRSTDDSKGQFSRTV
ncbi:MAG: oxygen-independent coproporphyrinogen III oxidase [Candidatus Zixiibacteriota bacterium]|nr:MAG: oxygen-independent coproporphyrinogen III oxidase [candidate division Zixibacteria bacterium]